MSKLRVGLVGCGGMGSHLARQCAALENAEIAATSDVTRERAEELGRELGARAFHDYKDLLKEGGVDAVIVATPNDSHAEISIAAARAGKHIFCEKPMALSVRDCDAMIQAAEEYAPREPAREPSSPKAGAAARKCAGACCSR